MSRSIVVRNMKKWIAATALVGLLPISAVAQETEPGAMVIDVGQASSVDDLLEKVKEGFERPVAKRTPNASGSSNAARRAGASPRGRQGA